MSITFASIGKVFAHCGEALRVRGRHLALFVVRVWHFVIQNAPVTSRDALVVLFYAIRVLREVLLFSQNGLRVFRYTANVTRDIENVPYVVLLAARDARMISFYAKVAGRVGARAAFSFNQ